MGQSEITAARNYERGAAGPARHGRAAADRRLHHLRRGAGQPRQAELRDRLGRVRHRLGHRHQDLQRRHLRRRVRQRRPDDPGDRQAQRAAHRRRHHRRGPGRHPGRARRARRQPRLQGPGRDDREVREERQGERRRSARSPSSWCRPAPTSCWAAARSTSTRPVTAGKFTGQARARPGQGGRLHRRATPRPTWRRRRRASRSSACSPTATCRSTGPARRPSHGGTAPTRCTPNPTLPKTQPKLADQTRKALELLDDRRSDKGFFLQVEGASIDKQDHAADPCGQIGETIDFDAAIAAGTAFARSHPDTLVLVTADHGHSSQIVEPHRHPGPDRDPHHQRGREHDPGLRHRARPAARSRTPAPRSASPVFGPQAANIVGLTNQTDLFGTLKRALRVR